MRLRVVFEDPFLLRGSQRRRGLQRCWVQLQPGHTTIANLAAHIHQAFGLHRSCPHGIILCIDGFVLPSFESTYILLDEDIIMVKRNGVKFKDASNMCDNQNKGHILLSNQNSALNGSTLAITYPRGDSQGNVDDILPNGHTPQMKTSSEIRNAQHKRKSSKRIRGATLGIMNSLSDPQEDKKEDNFHENIAYSKASNKLKTTKRRKKLINGLQVLNTSVVCGSEKDLKKYEVVDLPIGNKEHPQVQLHDFTGANLKTKHYNKFQGSCDTLIKDTQGDSHGVEENADIHVDRENNITLSSEMLNLTCNRKHTKKLQASKTSTVMQSRGDLQETEGDDHMVTPTSKIRNSKRKRKHSSKLQGLDDIAASTVMQSHGDLQEIEGDAGLKNGDLTHMVTPTSNIGNSKHKRKHSSKLQGSDDVVAKIFQEDSHGDDENLGLCRSIAKNEEPSRDMMSVKHNIEYSDKLQHSKGKSKHSTKLQTPENVSKGNEDELASEHATNVDVKKLFSRSARRKKAKRIWWRAHGIKKKSTKNGMPDSDTLPKPSEPTSVDQNTDENEEIMPVVVRPGHIRFESSDTCDVHEHVSVSLQWNGTTSKKKGQKWGREKFNKWMDNDSSPCTHNEETVAMESELFEASNVEEGDDPVRESNGSGDAKNSVVVKQLENPESFLPLVRLPEEDDVLVYRVVELSSSSWCPELTGFRVGKVSSYDTTSTKVVLLPLPEYPLQLEETTEGQENTSLYKEDGSLEIDFPSLVDVRLLNARRPSDESVPVNDQMHPAPLTNQGNAVNEVGNGWEELNRAIKEKKSELEKKKTGSGPWSYGVLKRNALGPVLAMLRSGATQEG